MSKYLDKNLFSEENTEECNNLRENYIQEPDDEEEHLVKPFEFASLTSDSCVPVKEEIVSKISSHRNDERQ